MRSKLFLWVLAGLTAVAFIAAPAAWACGRSCCPGHEKCCKDMAWMVEASIQVADLADGVKVTATGEDPDTVKAIQKHFAKMAKECPGHEGMAWRKDAAFEVLETSTGAVLTVTSSNSETVKAVQEHFAKMSEHCCKNGAMAWKKDAKIQVSNLPNGVTITVTSENPETVKAIQEHAAYMAKDDGEKKGCMHGHDKDKH